jgi:hypothetical protein
MVRGTTIQARVKPLSFNAPDNWVGLAARYADFNNHYYITARSPSNELHLKKTVGGTFTTLQSVPFTIVTGVWYKSITPTTRRSRRATASASACSERPRSTTTCR